MIRWDTSRIPANELSWMPDQVADSDRAVNGVAYAGLHDGGGIWVASMTVSAKNPDKVRYAMSLLTLADQGATVFLLPCQPLFAPYPLGAPPADTTYSDRTSHSDGSLFTTRGITIVLAQDTAERATVAKVTLVASAPLLGNEEFGVDYPTLGRHMHRVCLVDPQSDGSVEITFRPPWREDVTAGAVLDFGTPSCLMTLTTSPRSAFSGVTRPVKIDTLTLTFEETWPYVSATS